jgi:hypothetical protein
MGQGQKRNKLLVPEANKAMYQFKYEMANEVGIGNQIQGDYWGELSREGWHGLDKELQERHRSDLLQVLAYSTISASKRVVCCLAYPCRFQTWYSPASSGRKTPPLPLLPHHACYILYETQLWYNRAIEGGRILCQRLFQFVI